MPAYMGRMDNVNHTMREFTIDGRSTNETFGNNGEFLLRSDLDSFTWFGPHCIADITVKTCSLTNKETLRT